jgi:hypothetical protein
MSNIRWAGILLVLGFLMVIVGTAVGPPGLYDEPDLGVRLGIIGAHPGNWLASNSAWALAALTTAAGMFAFSMELRSSRAGGVAALGGLAMTAGAIFFALQLYFREIKPAEYYETISFFSVTFVWLTSIGLLAYGVAFFMIRYATLLAVFLLGVPIMLAAFAMMLGSRFYFNFPPQTFYLLTAIAGILFLWRGKPSIGSEARAKRS